LINKELKSKHKTIESSLSDLSDLQLINKRVKVLKKEKIKFLVVISLFITLLSKFVSLTLINNISF
jgi:hypothetical protein